MRNFKVGDRILIVGAHSCHGVTGIISNVGLNHKSYKYYIKCEKYDTSANDEHLLLCPDQAFNESFEEKLK